MKRAELASQLEIATARRRELAEQLRQDPSNRRDIEPRLKALDERGARLEREILEADDVVADALARGVTNTPPLAQQIRNLQRQLGEATETVPPPLRDFDGNIGRVVALEAIAFVLLGAVVCRFVWTRAKARFSRPAIDQSSRFDQLQQAVDVIALEVERISEGQRFVAKMINEKQPAAIDAGEARPIPAKRKVAAPIQASAEVG
jgi:hypothetical protein